MGRPDFRQLPGRGSSAVKSRHFIAATLTAAWLGTPLTLYAQRDDVSAVRDFESRDKSKQIKAAAAISNSGDKIRILRTGLEHQNPDVRIQYLWLIGKDKPAELVGAVRDIVGHDPSASVRVQGMSILHRLKDRSATEVFRIAVRTEPDTLARATAVRLLSYYDGKHSIGDLREALSDKDATVQLAAAKELGRHGDISGLKQTIDHLKSTEWEIRGLAAEALGKIGVGEVTPLLEVLKQDVHEPLYVREAAETALLDIHLVKLPKPQQNTFLKKALSDERTPIRRWAAAEMIQRRDNDLVAELRSVSKTKGHKAHREAATAIRMLD